MSILTWCNLFQALWLQAAKSRGTMTTQSEAADSVTTLREWPRTTAADMLAIVALVDPVLAELPIRLGGFGVAQLWQTEILVLESFAGEAASVEYAHNRSTWSALLALAAYLESIGAPLPAAGDIERTLDALWAAPYRNDTAPTPRVLEEGDAEKQWTAQRAEYNALRGVEPLTEPVAGSLLRSVPRTTRADVMRLYDYWSRELLGSLINPALHNTMGREAQMQRWSAIRDDVDQLARRGDPAAVYPKNAEFWAESLRLSTNLAAWGQVPRTFDLVAASTKTAILELPERVIDAASSLARAAGEGFWSVLKRPLWIGGGVVAASVAAYFLLRRRPEVIIAAPAAAEGATVAAG